LHNKFIAVTQQKFTKVIVKDPAVFYKRRLWNTIFKKIASIKQ